MPQITIHSSPAQVWHALTNPALRKKWFFGVDTKTDWKPGSPISHTGEFGGKPYEDKGVIKEIESGKRLVHTHWSSMSGKPDRPENYETIRYALKERDGATELSVTEDNVATEKQRETSNDMWKKALGALKKVVEH